MTLIKRRSHPHPDSCLIKHSQGVARYTRDILRTSLSESLWVWSDFFSCVAGNCHDILKDTEAFDSHLDGAPSSPVSRHTGGSALIAWLVCRKILANNPQLLESSSLRNLTPHIIFNVVAAHHSRLKQIDVFTQHKEAIKHWRETRSIASCQLLLGTCSNYDCTFEISDLDSAVGIALQNQCRLEKDFEDISGDDLFLSYFLSRLCLGALCKADVFSARIQESGQSELPSFPKFEGKASFSVNLAEFNDTKGLNGLRSQFQNQVCQNWDEKHRLFQLKAPTGLGKTVAVARILEKTLSANPEARVFYLAPTVAILNQVHLELKKFQTGGSTILLHYLAREFEDEDCLEYDPEGYAELKKRREEKINDLDAGLVVTTYHRAIELLSGLSKSSCLNLANLRNSIWVLDECQFLSHYQTMVSASVFSAVAQYTDSRFIFMSATPPGTEYLVKSLNDLKWSCPPSIQPLLTQKQLKEITSSPLVNGRRRISPLPDVRLLPELARRIENFKEENPSTSLLILLNLARDARELCETLNCKVDFLITTYLRPIDIRQHLAEADRLLSKGEPVLMIATSIVQAGVDLDFDAGFIELNDLRDFRQGSGRVGRSFNEKRGCCEVFAFELWDNRDKCQPSWIRQRFARSLSKAEGDDVVADALKRMLQITEKSIHEVLSTHSSFDEIQVEAIERKCSESASQLCVKVYERLAWGLHRSYDNILYNDDVLQGFKFADITKFLTRDLDDDSECSALAVYVEGDEGKYSSLQDSMGEYCDAVIDAHKCRDNKTFEKWKRVRILKREIQSDVAPYLIRRCEVTREFLGSSSGCRSYEEFDFWLIINSPQYSTETGWGTPGDDENPSSEARAVVL